MYASKQKPDAQCALRGNPQARAPSQLQPPAAPAIRVEYWFAGMCASRILFGEDWVRIPMMVMGDSDLIVMVVSERNDHHDRSEATLALRWCLN